MIGEVMQRSYVGWYLQFKLLEPRPAFVAFAERHSQRPAALRARQIDDGLLAAQKST